MTCCGLVSKLVHNQGLLLYDITETPAAGEVRFFFLFQLEDMKPLFFDS